MSAASAQPSPVAPGAMISIFGQRLADSAQAAQTVPLPNRIGNTEVVMAGIPLSLLYASPTQVIAVTPQGLNANTSQQLLIRRGVTLSRPVSVDVAPAQPAAFGSGSQPVVMNASAPDGTPVLVSPDAPAQADDVLTLYASGLGLTDPVVPDGTAAPSDPAARTHDALQVTIGGMNTPVRFAGLAAGFVALYKVTVTVPAGVPAGNQPLVMTISGQSSPPVTVTIR